jgi:hypothetical protein
MSCENGYEKWSASGFYQSASQRVGYHWVGPLIFP